MFRKTITFTYEMKPEKTGFSFVCLDWDCVYSQGETVEECKRNAIEVTEMLLEELLKGELNKKQYPKIKEHTNNPFLFSLTFDLTKGKYINLSRIQNVKTYRQFIPAQSIS